MAITFDAITLPPDLVWIDEYDWSPIQQKVEYALSGNLIIQQGVKAAGRSITLAGGPDHGWITKTALDALVATLSSSAAHTLTLHDGRAFNVAWRHHEKPIESALVVDYSDPAPTDFYTLKVRFMTV